MTDDVVDVLARFHREVIVPDLDGRIATIIPAVVRVIDERIERIENSTDDLKNQFASIRGDLLSHFDSVYVRFD